MLLWEVCWLTSHALHSWTSNPYYANKGQLTSPGQTWGCSTSLANPSLSVALPLSRFQLHYSIHDVWTIRGRTHLPHAVQKNRGSIKECKDEGIDWWMSYRKGWVERWVCSWQVLRPGCVKDVVMCICDRLCACVCVCECVYEWLSEWASECVSVSVSVWVCVWVIEWVYKVKLSWVQLGCSAALQGQSRIIYPVSPKASITPTNP